MENPRIPQENDGHMTEGYINSGRGWADVDSSLGAQLHPLRTEPRHRVLGAEERGDVLGPPV